MSFSTVICIILLLFGILNHNTASLAFALQDEDSSSQKSPENLFAFDQIDSIKVDFSCQNILTDIKNIIRKTQTQQEVRVFKAVVNMLLVLKDQSQERFVSLGKMIQEMMEKVDQVAAVKTTSQPSNDEFGRICIDRYKREHGKYLGCYSDHRQQRMFLGFAADLPDENSVDYCVKTCKEKGFVYAGLQDRYF